MPRFAANLGYLFTERPLIERIGAAAAAGFNAVELQFPYDIAPYGRFLVVERVPTSMPARPITAVLNWPRDRM